MSANFHLTDHIIDVVWIIMPNIYDEGNVVRFEWEDMDTINSLISVVQSFLKSSETIFTTDSDRIRHGLIGYAISVLLIGKDDVLRPNLKVVRGVDDVAAAPGSQSWVEAIEADAYHSARWQSVDLQIRSSPRL